jgi:competence protein ComEA
MQRSPQQDLDLDAHPDPQPDPFTGTRAVRPAMKRGLRARLDDLAVVLAVRTGVSPRAVLGLLLVAVLVLAVFGVRLAVVRARSAPVLIAPAAAAASGAASSAAPAPGGSGPAAGGPAFVSPSSDGPLVAGDPGSTRTGGAGQVVVHVVGQVRRPGVITLGTGSRVQDALTAAGGATGRADLTAINLARPLVDGEQVLVPRPGQAPVSAPMAPGAGGAGASGPAGHSVIDLNTATLTDLDALSGIGPVLAQRILDWRAEHGRFSSVDELTEVSGIGDATLQRIRPQVRV